MNFINDIGGNIHCGLITKGNLGAPQVIVDGLRQGDDIQALFTQQVCGLGGAIAAQDNQTVKIHIIIGLNHLGNLVHAVLILVTHVLKRLAGGTQDGAADGQGHQTYLTLNQALIAITEAIDFHFLAIFLIQCLCNASQGRVQTLAIAAACQHTNAFHASSSLIYPVIFLSPP